MRSRPLIPIGIGLLTVGAGLWLAARLKQGTQAIPDPVPQQPPPNPLPAGNDPDATDDVTALARMLASETIDYGARVVIGWMAIQTARRRKLSLYERLTAGNGYGPQQKDGVVRYASTAKPPTSQTVTLAAQLLSEALKPSARIRALGHSAWVEDLKLTENSAAQLLRKQAKPADFGGIWARLRGTRWYLYNDKMPILRWDTGSARAALDTVPVLDPLDASLSV